MNTRSFFASSSASVLVWTLAVLAPGQSVVWSKVNTQYLGPSYGNGTRAFVGYPEQRLYDLVHGQYLPGPTFRQAEEMSPDGKYVKVRRTADPINIYSNYTFDFYERATGKKLFTLGGNGYEPGVPQGDARFSEDGRYVLVNQSGFEWQSYYWTSISDLNYHQEGTGKIVDIGNGMVTTSRDYSYPSYFRILRLSDGMLVGTSDKVSPVFTPDCGRGGLIVDEGSALRMKDDKVFELARKGNESPVGVTLDGTAVVFNDWRTNTGTVVRLDGTRQEYRGKGEVSPDGRYAMFPFRGIKRAYWNVAEGTRFIVDQCDYAPLGFDPSNRAIVRVNNSQQRTISETGEVVETIDYLSDQDFVTENKISKDGKTVVSLVTDDYEGIKVIRQDRATGKRSSWFSFDRRDRGWRYLYNDDASKAWIILRNPDTTIPHVRQVNAAGKTIGSYTLPATERMFFSGGEDYRLMSGDRLLVYKEEGEHGLFSIYDGDNGNLLKSLDAGKIVTNYWAMSGDERKILLATTSKLVMLDVETGRKTTLKGDVTSIVRGSDAFLLSFDGGLISHRGDVYRVSDGSRILHIDGVSETGYVSPNNRFYLFRDNYETKVCFLPAVP